MKMLLPLLALVLFSINVSALDFDRLGGTFTMDGMIEKHDSSKFLVELAKWKDPPTVFHIHSKGGNLDEAMKIGKIIRASQIPVWTGECQSACVFIYVSGVEKVAQGKIVLHRPYFEKSYFSDLTSMEAKEKYDELKQRSVDYLKSMEVSQGLIDRIFQTGSTEVDVIEKDDANTIFGYRSPFYDEWLTAKCGKYTEEQTRVLRSWGDLQAASAMDAIADDESIPKSDDFASNASKHVEGAQLALQMEKAGMLEPYIELSKIHHKCEEKSANSHVYGFHRSIQKHLPGVIKIVEQNKRIN